MDELSREVESLAIKEDASSNETGLVYDPRMLAHVNEFSSAHPERPERVSCIWRMLEGEGFVKRCSVVESRDATKDEVLKVHSEDHFQSMEAIKDLTAEQVFQLSMRYNSIFINKESFSCALLSAGCLLELTDQVLQGKLRSGIAVIRPPGHHAGTKCCAGFCIFNNVAMATQMALNKHKLKRVLIVDWDVHHGDGTQKMFWDDKRVLFVSLHRYDNGYFYPGKPGANHTYVGGAGARGFNVNVAWNNGWMGDSEYLAAFHQVVLPVAYEFNPELVLVSCGFDAAQGDPLGGYNITPSGYAHMTHLLKGLAKGRLVLALEYYCGRYINQHMLRHGESLGHHVVLSLADLSVWCFACDAYLHNKVLDPAVSSAHQSKFGHKPH